jgi:hypothetical protein
MPGMGVTPKTPGIRLASESSMDTTDAPCVAGMARTVGTAPLTERSLAYG